MRHIDVSFLKKYLKIGAVPFSKRKKKLILFTQMLLHSEHSSQNPKFLHKLYTCLFILKNKYVKPKKALPCKLISPISRKKSNLISWMFWMVYLIFMEIQNLLQPGAWRYFNFRVVGPFCSVHITIKLNGNHKRFNFEVFFSS